MKFNFSIYLLLMALTKAEEDLGNIVKMCLFYPNPSGHARTDPILSQSCPSDHVHTFYGPQNIHPNTSSEQLRNTSPLDSSSPFVENQSLYWHPTIYQVTESGGQTTYSRVSQLETSPYYRWPDPNIASTSEFPPGFRMIAYSNQEGAGTGGETGANLFVECCDYVNGGEESCANYEGNPLVFPTNTCDFLGIAFAMPTCWDETKGIGTDNPFNHVAYTTDGTVNGPCPAGYDTRLPQIQLFLRINNYQGGTYMLSDGGEVFHVDFMNGWQENKLQEVIDSCQATGQPGYNPDCNCDQFLTPNDNPSPQVCDSDVKQFIIDEEIEILSELPRGMCTGPQIIEKSWDVEPPFSNTDCVQDPGMDDDEEVVDDDEEAGDDSVEGECSDSSLQMKFKKQFRLCDEWVAANPGRRCNKLGVREHCPVTCNAPEFCQSNSIRQFVVEETGKTKRCNWVAKDVEERCAYADMCNTCRETCAGINMCASEN